MDYYTCSFNDISIYFISIAKPFDLEDSSICIPLKLFDDFDTNSYAQKRFCNITVLLVVV